MAGKIDCENRYPPVREGAQMSPVPPPVITEAVEEHRGTTRGAGGHQEMPVDAQAVAAAVG